MLFSTSLILPLALLCQTASSLSVPAASAGLNLTRRAQQDASDIAKPCIDKIKQKQDDIKKHFHSDQAQVLVETDLQAVVETFEGFIGDMNQCNCTSKDTVDLDWYKALVIEVFASVQVVIEIVVGTGDQSLIEVAQEVFAQFKIHVAKFIDLVITVDVQIAVAIRDNVDTAAYAAVGINIVELVNGKVAGEVSGKQPEKQVPEIIGKGNHTGDP
ncbi:secreted protein [Melampsora americana]|nr:secreted protein [Melampsora americana]